jgi:hypothetical protein
MAKEPQVDDDVFKNPFGEALVSRLDPFTEAHPVGVMVSFISIFSGYVGNDVRIYARGKKMPLAFWPLLVGVSGLGRKGTATDLAKEIAEGAIPDFMLSAVEPGFDSGLGMVDAYRERLGSEGKPDPVVAIEEEMSKFADAAKKDRRLGVTATKGWDGATIQYKTAKETIRIPHPHMAFIGHMQPKLMKMLRNSKDSAGGTWNRFLFFWVKRSKSVPIFGTLPGQDAAFGQAVVEFRKMCVNARNIKRVEVPPKVAKIFQAKHRPAVEALTNVSEEISEFAERSLAYLMRLAALYALADAGTPLTMDGKGVYAQEKHFDAALALIRYSVESLKYLLSGNRDVASRSLFAQRILRWLQKNSPSTWSKMTVGVGRNHSRNSYLAALDELGDDVVIYTIPRPKGQRGNNVGIWVTTPDKIPENAIRMMISEIDPDDPEYQEDDDGLPNFRVEEDPTYKVDVKVNRVRQEQPAPAPAGEEEPVEAEIVEDEPETPTARLRALPAPKTPKATVKPPTATTAAPEPAPEADKPKPQVKKGGAKVTPGGTARRAPARGGTATGKPSWFS